MKQVQLINGQPLVVPALLQLFVQKTFLDEDQNGMTFMDKRRHNQRLKAERRDKAKGVTAYRKLVREGSASQ